MSDQEPIDLACPQCEKKLRVPASAIGKRIRCPACSTVINVPAETGTTAEPPKPVSKPRVREPEPDADDERDRDDDDRGDDRPRRARRRSDDDDDRSAYVDEDDYERIRRPIRRPRSAVGVAFKFVAISMLVIATLALFLDLFNVVFAFVAPEPPFNPQEPEFIREFQKNSRGPLAAAIQGALAIVALVIVIGSIQMLRQKTWGLALTACILSMVHIGSFCCCAGLPLGIWGLVLLLNQDVKDSFS